MVVKANRVKAKVLIAPKSPADTSKALATNSQVNPADPANNADYEIREVRLFGAVSMHQDPAPNKTKGTDATGEALILLNEGPGKAVFNLYHRDPTAVASRPRRQLPGRQPRSSPRT